MAFEKLSKAITRIDSTNPSVNLTSKGILRFNKAFLDSFKTKAGVCKYSVGDAFYFNLLYDKDTDTFGIEVLPSQEGAVFETVIRKNTQVQTYIQTTLRSIGIGVKDHFRQDITKDKATGYWLFKIPKEQQCEPAMPVKRAVKDMASDPLKEKIAEKGDVARAEVKARIKRQKRNKKTRVNID